MNSQTIVDDLVIMLGDSDISRWPAHLFPKVGDRAIRNNLVIARGGACLLDVCHMVEAWLREHSDQASYVGDNGGKQKVVIVGCAGENDISMGRSVDAITVDFEQLIRLLFQTFNVEKIFFLGPKYEPWLSEDSKSRRIYTKLSKALRRSVDRNEYQSKIDFIDCLTMFCDKQDVPGAIEGYKALPNKDFFVEDGLHLSEKGYFIWKDEIEHRLIFQQK